MKEFDYKEFAHQNALRESEEVELITCPETEKELYYSSGSDKIYIIDSFGECRDCSGHFHVSAMKNMTGYEWPIIYDGGLCKKCFEDEEVALTAEEKKALRDSSYE